MERLKGLRVAVLVTDGYEESELTKPVEALKKEGATVHIISPKHGKVQGFKHHDKASKVDADRTFAEASAEDYDAVHLPGGALNADALRAVPEARAFVRQMVASGKPLAAICHAPWLLVSAGLVKGKHLTSYFTIEDDIRNAGGRWTDDQVVEDGNWVTSRKPDDIPAFIEAMTRKFQGARQRPSEA